MHWGLIAILCETPGSCDEHTGVARPYRACRSRPGLHELLDLTAHKALLLDPCSPLIAWRLMLKPETRRLIEVARSV